MLTTEQSSQPSLKSDSIVRAVAIAPLFAHLQNRRQSNRAKRKENLLALNPRCHHCGCKLTAVNGRDNTATLIRDCLSCPEHFDEVSKAAKKLRFVEADKKRRSAKTDVSSDERKELMQLRQQRDAKILNKQRQLTLNANSKCCRCGDEMTIRAKQSNTATLVGDDLVCRLCFDSAKIEVNRSSSRLAVSNE